MEITYPIASVLLTLTETAQMLRKTDSQLRWQIHAGKAPRSALIGGRRMFRRSDVEQWIDAQFEAETKSA